MFRAKKEIPDLDSHYDIFYFLFITVVIVFFQHNQAEKTKSAVALKNVANELKSVFS